MEATVNKQAAIDGYAAFAAMDADAAMKDISDSVEWVVSGDSSLTGTYNGKDEVGGLWMKLLEKGFRTTPREFIAEGDKVVAICDTNLGQEQAASVNLLTYDGDGKLIRFETYGGEELLNRTFPR
jgi:ketosteroid isomerase-like protein